MNATHRLILSILVVAGSFFWAWITQRPLENKTFSGAPVLREMPNFKAVNLAGKEWMAQDYIQKNAPILIHFWGTWCAPCEEEFPGLIQMIKDIKVKSQVQVVLIAVKDKEVDVRKFLDEKKFSIPEDVFILLDSTGDVQKMFNTIKVPETYLFSSNFQTLRKFVGPQNWVAPDFIEYFKSI